LEDLVSRHVIELSQSCVHTLGIVEGDLFCAVASEDTLRLPAEHDLLDLLDITALLVALFVPHLEIEVIVHDGLAFVTLSTVVSAFHQLLDEPLDDGIDLLVVKTLNLLRGKHLRAVHLLESRYNLFRELDLLTHVHLILEFNVDVEVATGY
jgi:hypothetical protein